MDAAARPAVLEVSGLTVDFSVRYGAAGRACARVLDGVSLRLCAGEVLAVVGESGCGKSMTALAILGLVPSPPGRVSGGSVKLAGRELRGLDERALCRVRGGEIGMIFQEPMTSLNPVLTVGEQIAEVVRLHDKASSRAAAERAVAMLRAVDMPEPELRARAYPHQLSGGMRQRVMIAIGLVCRPRVLIADEPTTALDATVQAQIFDLLDELRRDTGTAIMLITHDMGAVAELADRVAVMYAGRIVEQGPVAAVLSAPLHPYTRALIDCVPHLQLQLPQRRRALAEIPGVVPAPTELGAGCAFAPRCALAEPRCHERKPVLGRGAHRAACLRLDERPR